MPTEQQENGSTDDTSGQEQQGQQQQTTEDISGNGTQQQAGGEQQPQAITKDTVLPDDHPVVKQMKDDKAKLATARQELAEARAQAKRTTDLETELQARPTQEALDTLQTRYDRLEAFLQAAGGPLARALDSRTFTRDLFESDKDIATLVKDWHKANPNATSTALGSGAAAPDDKSKPSMNDLLRSAAKG